MYRRYKYDRHGKYLGKITDTPDPGPVDIGELGWLFGYAGTVVFLLWCVFGR